MEIALQVSQVSHYSLYCFPYMKIGCNYSVNLVKLVKQKT